MITLRFIFLVSISGGMYVRQEQNPQGFTCVWRFIQSGCRRASCPPGTTAEEEVQQCTYIGTTILATTPCKKPTIPIATAGVCSYLGQSLGPVSEVFHEHAQQGAVAYSPVSLGVQKGGQPLHLVLLVVKQRSTRQRALAFRLLWCAY